MEGINELLVQLQVIIETNRPIAVGFAILLLFLAWFTWPHSQSITTSASNPQVAELVDQNFTLNQSTDVNEEPSASSAKIIRLHNGIAVKVVGIIAGNSWLQIELPDGRVGYVPAGAIPGVVNSTAQVASNPPQPQQAPAVPPAGQEDMPDPAAEKATATNFKSTLERWKVTTASSAYAAPDTNSPELYPVAAGSLVDVIAKSSDDKWAWVKTENDSPAFVQLASLSFVEAAKPKPAETAEPAEPAKPPPPDELKGPAVAVTTSVLIVDGHKVSLAGLHGEGGKYRDDFQKLIDSQGGEVDCSRQGNKYSCKFPDGNDVGRIVLYNGAARVSAGASADYRDQAKSAEDGHRGLWQ